MHTAAQFLDLRRATQEFPLGRRKLWQLIREGRLPAFRLDHKVIIRRRDLERLLTAMPLEPVHRDSEGAARSPRSRPSEAEDAR
jgi:Helix-turn-helix domain